MKLGDVLISCDFSNLNEVDDFSDIDDFGYNIYGRVRTPLMLASEYGNNSAVIFLIEKGASIDKMNSDGCTSLYYAVCENRETVVMTLLENGASHTLVSDDQMPPLFAACERGHVSIVRTLLNMGAPIEIDPCTSSGSTALLAASYWGQESVKTIIIQYINERRDALEEATLNHSNQDLARYCRGFLYRLDQF